MSFLAGSQQSLFRFFLPYNFAAEKFRRSLQNAQVTEDSQNGKVLTFTVPPPWLSTQNCTSIYIRSAYEDIYRILESEPHNHFLILGNPGTGKSYFALYMLYRTFQESTKTVVFHRSSESVVFIFKKGEDVIQLPENLAASSSVVNEENVLYLFDAGTRKSSSVCVGKSRLIVFSSPSRENTCEFIKMGLINLYMPTWSKEELLLARKLEQYHVQVTEQHVNDLFEKFGGIVRYVLEVEEQRRVDNYHKLDATISHCTLETIRSLGPDDTDDESPLIFHRTVLGSEYDNYEFKFASQYVSDKVVKAIQETAFDEMEAFVRCCDIVMPLNTSSLIRWLLEQVSSKIDDNTDWKVHQL